MTDAAGTPRPVELLRVSSDLLEVVAQLVWAAAPARAVLRGPEDDAGLVRLLVDAPLDERQSASLEAGLDALLAEPRSRQAGTYLREVRDRTGRRRELATPIPPGEWRGQHLVVGPFEREEAARTWTAEAVRAPAIGDVIEQAGRWFVDVFPSDAGDAMGGGGAAPER